jgi:hypothetical protein
MSKESILNLLDSSNITNELKEAYSFMLLSRGYSVDDIKILDDYVFLLKKKDYIEDGESVITDQVKCEPLKNKKKKNLPQNLVCLSSTSDYYNKRDHTLYSLNGGTPVTKGRLVWSIIKLYQKEKSPLFEGVTQLFNKELNLLRNTVIAESSLESLRPDRQKRFYYHDSDIIISEDGIRYAVSNQWTADKMNSIISFAQSLGWKVESTNPLVSDNS